MGFSTTDYYTVPLILHSFSSLFYCFRSPCLILSLLTILIFLRPPDALASRRCREGPKRFHTEYTAPYQSPSHLSLVSPDVSSFQSLNLLSAHFLFFFENQAISAHTRRPQQPCSNHPCPSFWHGLPQTTSTRPIHEATATSYLTSCSTQSSSSSFPSGYLRV